MMDHFDGRCSSTWGRRPALVWFVEVATREAAAASEVELKQQLVSDRRAVLRRIAEFQEAAALVSPYPPLGGLVNRYVEGHRDLDVDCNLTGDS